MTTTVRQNQCERLKEHLRNPFKGKVNRQQAAQELGIYELAARIKNLEDMGFVFAKPKVDVRDKWLQTIRMTEYSIIHDPEFPKKQDTGSLF